MQRYPLNSNLIPQSIELIGDLRKRHTLDYILHQRFDSTGRIIARAAEKEEIFDISADEYEVLKALVSKCGKKENNLYYPDKHPCYTDGVPFCPVCKTDLSKYALRTQLSKTSENARNKHLSFEYSPICCLTSLMIILCTLTFRSDNSKSGFPYTPPVISNTKSCHSQIF
jgi:hypothetical protein